MLLNSGVTDLFIKLVGLCRHLIYFFRVLASLILKLLNFSIEISNDSIQVIFPLSLLFNTRLQLLYFFLIVFTLVRVLHSQIIVGRLLFQVLKLSHRF